MAGVKQYEVGDVITSKKGAKATVIEVADDHIVIERDDGTQQTISLAPSETPEEKRRRENIEAGRHPMWISLEDAPKNAATGRRRI